jgi:hypothetical protein
MKRMLVFVLVAAGTGTATSETSSLQRCREVRDSTARLACYDAIPLAAPAMGARPSPPPAAAPAAPAAVFGLESRTAPAASPQPLPSIDSNIDGVFDGWLPRSQLKLANGQVWEIADGSQAAYDLKSPKVRVTRGVSGSFFMAVEGVAQTPRVRRVK